ncbi:uncharacterized protein LOC124341285 isoform X2 [Daphnia pulicaria]|uniref:uncharacterized protein LOC124341285 isoform X2 n=1 Tax=Daphnia pulicaria TaxID=35523 RepID=UPI001EEBD645|nr:uncharacterized protein LOC124341285 isoform X2 [Daphnia pulicaria]
MTTATDESTVELIDVSDDDDCCSLVSQPSSDIIFIEEVEFHYDQKNNERSSKRKKRTKTIDVYFTSASGESNKLVTPLSLDTAPIIGGVVTSEKNGDLESNKISDISGPSLLPPEGIAVPIKEIAAIVNKTSDTHDVENVNDGSLQKENNEEAMKETVTANVLGNSQSTDNIKKQKYVSLPKNDFECNVCLKYSTKNSLVRHRLKHSDPETWKKCPFCDYKTPDSYVLKVHLRKHDKRRRTKAF